jgi:AAA family ATP:ADP antiporter
VLIYLRLGVADSYVSLSAKSAYLFKITLMAHLVGLIVSLFGTKVLLRAFGEKTCLMLVPLIVGTLLFIFMIHSNPHILAVILVALKAINYAFGWPVRESLYIPTVKDIKFKARSWIDAFGGKFAKVSGAAFNQFVATAGGSVLACYSLFFATVVSCWFVAAYLLGKRFEQAVEKDEVIGN